MKVIVTKTHAKTRGIGLYIKGEIYEKNDVEDADYKIKGEEGSPILLKEYKGKIETKEEKRTSGRKTK